MAQAPAGTVCVMCLAPATKQCSGCKALWYCTRECQRKHWVSHKDECGKVVPQERKVVSAEVLKEVEEKEKQFQLVTDIVKKHRETGVNKNVFLTRYGDQMYEDLEDARNLPGIKDQLDSLDAAMSARGEQAINMLFSAAEGVGRAKTLAQFEEMKKGNVPTSAGYAAAS
eukprot:TRINITY_DN49896_c0_g1_i1.p1 TRINITY_DN49896_c0_g1~~TRINITY_DN49896_c0_g1_i1.p1  ORF type:complete len:170 (+),score=46.11 TRINITY_DN49896_c0_g1_i1:53-562(+)